MIYANFRNARIVKLIKVEVNEGEGVTGDPIRRVVYYVRPETGELLFKLNETIERANAGTDEMFK